MRVHSARGTQREISTDRQTDREESAYQPNPSH